MFKNYLKIAFTNIRKNKFYTLINVLGLALGLCGCMMIFFVTGYERSFDQFHPAKDRIYRITSETAGGRKAARIPPPAPGAIRQELSGLEAVSGAYPFYGKITIRPAGEMQKSFDAGIDGTEGTSVLFTDLNYFSIFQYTWLAGNPVTSLNAPFQVVLTESKARTYFGDVKLEELIGRQVIYDDSINVRVSGIIKDWQENTDFPYTDFISLQTIAASGLTRQSFPGKWHSVRGNPWMWSFVKLSNGVTAAQIDRQFPAFIKAHEDGDLSDSLRLSLQPLANIHFDDAFSGDDIRKAHLPTLYGLSAVALFILLIAVINFINLSTAQTIRRSKDTAIRKVLGGSRTGVISQYLTEALIITLLGTCIALLSVRSVLRLFQEIVPGGLHFSVWQPSNLVFVLSITVIASLLAGIYPAWILSAYPPAIHLNGKGTPPMAEKWWLRKALIVFQFTASLIFIISTIVTGRQVRYMLNTDYGYKRDAVVTLMTNWRDSSSKMALLMEQLNQLPAVGKIIREANAPIGWGHSGGPVVYKGKTKIELAVEVDAGNDEFIPFYDMHLVAGRNIQHSDSLKELVINETCSGALGFSRPGQSLGQFLYWNDKPYPIVGVVKDFHEASFREPIRPLLIGNIPQLQQCIGIRLVGGPENVQATLDDMEKIWKKVYPNREFRYAFMDAAIAYMYEKDKNTAYLVQIFMILTIFISGMGLFGLALFTTERRTKEIGIRKVLGASVCDVVVLLTGDFVKLVGIAFCIASPIAWYVMHRWMEDFAYHIVISCWIFIIAGLAAVFLAAATISFQTIRAAIANPVDSLKIE